MIRMAFKIVSSHSPWLVWMSGEATPNNGTWMKGCFCHDKNGAWNVPFYKAFQQRSKKNINYLQAAAVLVYRARSGGDLPAYVKGFQILVQDYLPIEKDEYHVFKINQTFKDVSAISACCLLRWLDLVMG